MFMILVNIKFHSSTFPSKPILICASSGIRVFECKIIPLGVFIGSFSINLTNEAQIVKTCLHPSLLASLHNIFQG